MGKSLRKRIARRNRGRDPPVRLVLPGEDRVSLSATPEIEIVARTRRADRRLCRGGVAPNCGHWSPS